MREVTLTNAPGGVATYLGQKKALGDFRVENRNSAILEAGGQKVFNSFYYCDQFKFITILEFIMAPRNHTRFDKNRTRGGQLDCQHTTP